MAGHSKWANIKHKKAAQDYIRGRIFTKLAKEIMVASKLGGSDENANARLRSAVIKARLANMPKDNIERAIKKGAGELEGVNYEEATYEGYGPGGVAIMLEVMTDKKSRTIPEIKNIFTKAGTSLAEAGSVSYLFDHLGLMVIKASNILEEAMLELALEAGGSDFETEGDDIFIIKTAREDFASVQEKMNQHIEKNKWEVIESGLSYIPKSFITLDEVKTKANQQLIENLTNHDDVQNVYSNLESEE